MMTPQVPVDARPARVPVGIHMDGAPLGASVTYSVVEWIRLLRVRQWTKNVFVLAPLVFSGRLRNPDEIGLAVLATLSFCIAASGVYCWNDVADRHSDQFHPVKRARPVASGRIRASAATAGGALLVSLALGLGAMTAPSLGFVLAGYVLLNQLYTRWLKHVVIVDVFVLGSFFVLRLLGGAVTIGVQPSIWLLLCGGLLSLYLGFQKRRHELTLLETAGAQHREVLQEYARGFLDQVSTILLAVTAVAYVMYTLGSRTAAEVGSELLSYSTVFVLFGMFRYLFLIRQERQLGDPSDVLLRDRALLVDIALWIVYCTWVIYRPFA